MSTRTCGEAKTSPCPFTCTGHRQHLHSDGSDGRELDNWGPRGSTALRSWSTDSTAPPIRDGIEQYQDLFRVGSNISFVLEAPWSRRAWPARSLFPPTTPTPTPPRSWLGSPPTNTPPREIEAASLARDDTTRTASTAAAAREDGGNGDDDTTGRREEEAAATAEGRMQTRQVSFQTKQCNTS